MIRKLKKESRERKKGRVIDINREKMRAREKDRKCIERGGEKEIKGELLI